MKQNANHTTHNIHRYFSFFASSIMCGVLQMRHMRWQQCSVRVQTREGRRKRCAQVCRKMIHRRYIRVNRLKLCSGRMRLIRGFTLKAASQTSLSRDPHLPGCWEIVLAELKTRHRVRGTGRRHRRQRHSHFLGVVRVIAALISTMTEQWNKCMHPFSVSMQTERSTHSRTSSRERTCRCFGAGSVAVDLPAGIWAAACAAWWVKPASERIKQDVLIDHHCARVLSFRRCAWQTPPVAVEGAAAGEQSFPRGVAGETCWHCRSHRTCKARHGDQPGLGIAAGPCQVKKSIRGIRLFRGV